MAQNVVINGVTYQNVPEVDIPKSGSGTAKFYDTSGATATADDILSGKSAFGASGLISNGSIPTKASTDLQASGATVTVPAGYYASEVSKSINNGSVSIASQSITATPSASFNSTTRKVTVTVSGSGDVAATKTAGYISAGSVTGSVSASGSGTFDYPTNVVDTTIASGGAAAGDIRTGKSAYVNGSLVSGQLNVPTVSQDSDTKVLSIS